MAGQILGAQGLLSNPLLATLAPEQQQNLIQLQQRQAIGQALLGQGLQPLDAGNAQVGGMAYHVSPLNGFAKLLQAYVGNKLSMDSMGQQAQIMGQMYGNSFGGAAPAPSSDGSGAPMSLPPMSAADAAPMQGISSGMGLNAPTPIQLGQALGAQAPTSSNGPLTLPGRTPQESMQMYSILGPDAYGKLLAAQIAPTDATRMARAAGLDPAQANADALFKANFVAPVTGTGIFRDPRTMQPTAYSPNIPDGAKPLFDAAGNVAQVAPIAGAQGVMQGNAAATAEGGAQFKFTQKYNPATHQMEWIPDASLAAQTTPGAAPTLNGIFAQQESSGGKTAPDNPFQIQQGTFNQYKQGGESWNNAADRTAVAKRVLASYNQKYGGDLGRIATAYFSGEGNVAPAGSPTPFIKNTADANGKTVSSYVGDILGRAGGSGFGSSGGVAAAPPLGVQAGATTGATNQQNELSTKWTALNAQNQQAQSVISNLQNIKDLAGKAVTGPQSDRLNYVNGLLSLAGSDRASNMVDANALLDKNSNQIIAKLGQGGMGTDAARSILQSAYPNTHMQPGAINEAADNLIGLQQMTQAKAKLLAPLRNANDVTGYTNQELAFDQNADPRIWQMQGMNPDQQKAYVKNIPPAVAAQLLKQRGALKAMGAL